MKLDLVTIIVPVYKVEKYLQKCIESINNQTYKNLEIILVDDGSPDSCGKICDSYAKKDKRIKVIHKENGGLSSARNAGLDIAKGKFIAFVDSDDYVDEKYIETLYNAIKKDGSDLAICGVQVVDENGNKLDSSQFKIESGFIEEKDKFEPLFSKNSVRVVVAWNKLYKKELWNNLRYLEGHIHEDEYVIYDLLCAVKNGISFIDANLYYYLTRSTSIMNSNVVKPAFLDAYYCSRYRLSKMDKNSEYYKKAVLQNYMSCFIVYEKIKTNRNLVKTLKNEYKKDYKQNKNFLILKHKIKSILFLYFPFIFKVINKK